MLNLFNTYEFTFAGESSVMYGLYVCDINNKENEDTAFGTTGNIVESRTVNRIRPIHQGVNYHEDPLEFKLIFGTDKELCRYDLQDISVWLTGHQEYQWLSIDQPDLEPYQYRCLITDLEPITVGWIPHAFEATIHCDCPYAYGYPFEEVYAVNGKSNIVFRNYSTCWEYFKPQLKICVDSGTTSFSIINHDDNDHEFKFDGLPAAGCEIVIDNENGIITEKSGQNLYDMFNMNFFRLARGMNHLEITGNGSVTLSGRMMYNVGA